MKIADYETKIDEIVRQMPDRDAFFAVAFSKEEDRFQSFASESLDAGDALIVINGLIQPYGLDAQAIARMQAAPIGDVFSGAMLL